MNNEIRELNAAEIITVAGGDFDDGNWCGTVPRHWPFPRPTLINFGNVINPIVIGSLTHP